jgi:hypothetical protein
VAVIFVGMRSRAGRWAAQKSRERQWDLIRRMWPTLVIGLAATLTLAVLSQFIAHGWQAGFDFAGITTAGVAALAIVVMEGSGSLGTQIGSEAERWTEHELRKLRRSGCSVVSHIPFEKRDIDHAVLCASGAWAVETKWSTRAWGDLRDLRLREAAEAARRGAQQLGQLLGSRDVGVRMPVEPLVVLWGDWGEAVLPVGFGVAVVRGKDLRDWLHAQLAVGGDYDAAAACRGIRSWLKKRDQHIRKNDTRPAIVRIGPALLGLQILVGVLAATAGLLCGAVLGALPDSALAVIAVLVAMLLGLLARRVAPFKTAATWWSTGCIGGAALAIVVRVIA